MAKFILFLLTLALVAASTGECGGDLQQPPMTMPEQLRLYSSPAWLEDMAKLLPQISNTVHRSASFYKRELGPLGPIFRAISKMPEKSAADVRSKEEAFDAAMELMKRLFQQLLVPRGSARTAYDDDLAQRRQGMAEVVSSNPVSSDAQTTHRLGLFVRREMGPLKDILFVIRNMPENSADDVRIKDEAFDAATELLERKLRLLLPYRGPNAGFAVGKMPETTAAEVRSKEEARAAAKEMINRYLDKLLPVCSVKIDDEL